MCGGALLMGICSMCAVLSGDARLSVTTEREGEPAVPSQRHSMRDFPLEQSRDNTRFAFDQVMN